MEFLFEYGLFFAKMATIVLSIIIIFAFSFALAQRDKDERPQLKIKKINKRFVKYAEIINKKVMSKKEFKIFKKWLKKEQENRDKEDRQRVFYIEFKGDVKASATCSLTEEINAVLSVATPNDEVLVKINSAGGLVHSYGLAASQLKRIRDHKIPLIVAIDKVAASGGYMMAVVADRIIAAPFAIVGSIGVIAQLPNFHRFLKKRDIEFEQIMAGEYKRTLTVFGENTKKDRLKSQEDVEVVHGLFKDFITEHRPNVDIDKVSTGEHWHAIQALEMKLVDQIMTCDDYLMTAAKHADIYLIRFNIKPKVSQKLAMGIEAMFESVYNCLRRADNQH